MLLSPLFVYQSFLGCHEVKILSAWTQLSESYLRKNMHTPNALTPARIEHAYIRKFGDVKIDPADRKKIESQSEWWAQVTAPCPTVYDNAEGEWHRWLELAEIRGEATGFDYALARVAIGGMRSFFRLFLTKDTTKTEAIETAREMGWLTLALSDDSIIRLLVEKQKPSTMESLSLWLLSLAACDMATARRHRLAKPMMVELIPERRTRGTQRDLALSTAIWIESMGNALVEQGTLKHGGFRELADHLKVSEGSLRQCKSGRQLPTPGGVLWTAVEDLANRGDISLEFARFQLLQLQFSHLMTKAWLNTTKLGHTEDELLSVYARIPAYHRFLGQLAEVPGEAVTSSSPGFPC